MDAARIPHDVCAVLTLNNGQSVARLVCVKGSWVTVELLGGGIIEVSAEYVASVHGCTPEQAAALRAGNLGLSAPGELW